METKTPKRLGRPPGAGLGVKLGPRVGSRAWLLLNLKPGQSLYFEAPKSTVATMGQISTDIQRIDLSRKLVMSSVLAIQPKTRTVIDLIRVTRIKE